MTRPAALKAFCVVFVLAMTCELVRVVDATEFETATED